MASRFELNQVVNLPFTLHGELLLAKLVLVGAVVCLAATNRFRLTRALDQGLATGETNAVNRALRRNLTIKTGTTVAILSLVAWLGLAEPPKSM